MPEAVQTKQPDTTVKLPAAVLRASARATELSEEFKKGGNSGGMAITDVHSGETPVASLTPTSTPTLASAPTSVPTPTSAPQTKTFTEHDFKSMQGRFERAQQENQQLLNRVSELQRIAAYMQTPTNQQQPQPQPAAQRLISDKERTEYGEELIEVMHKAADEKYAHVISELQAKVNSLQQVTGAVQQNVAQDARSRLYQELQKEVPDWEEQNNDDGFKEWLHQMDPLSGSQRLVLLQNAFNTGQSSRVIAAFKGYKNELAALSPAQTQGSQPGNGAVRSDGNSGNANPDNSRSNAATTPAVDLTALAAPGRARSGQAPSSPDKSIITRDEIANFYKEVSLGKYRGRDQDYAAIERQIGEALKEGRVR